MSNLHTDLYKKMRSAAVEYAIFRWESAVVVAGTLLLTVFLPRPFAWWPGWAWPVLGVIALAAVIFSSLTDADTGAKVLRQLLEAQLDPKLLKDEGLRGQLEAAFTSLLRLEAHRLNLPPGPVRTQTDALAPLLTDWVSQFYQLLRYLDTHQRDFRIEQRREQVYEEIKTLSARRRFERNPQMLTRLDEGLEDLGHDWYTLRLLNAELRLALGQLPRQLQTFDAAVEEVRELQMQLLEEHATQLRRSIEEQTVRLSQQVARIHTIYTEALRRA